MGLIANYSDNYNPEASNRAPFLDDREKFEFIGYLDINGATLTNIALFPGKTLYLKHMYIYQDAGVPVQDLTFYDESRIIEVIPVTAPNPEERDYANEDAEIRTFGALKIISSLAGIQTIFFRITGYLRS